MRGMSSFQVKARVITIFLSIILIIGGCSSLRGEKNLKEPEKEEAPATEQASVVEQSTAEVSKIASEDDGKYYYVDFTGCLMKNNYTADGFYVGDEGYWVRKEKQRQDDVEPLSGKTYGHDPVFVIEIMNYSDEFYVGYLMSVSKDQKTIIVSGLGCTDEYTIE